jgi:hypothetical protein
MWPSVATVLQASIGVIQLGLPRETFMKTSHEISLCGANAQLQYIKGGGSNYSDPTMMQGYGKF